MLRYGLVPFFVLIVASCADRVQMPRGNSRGYDSARLIEVHPAASISDATERKVHRMIHTALEQQFTANGKSWGGSSADLVVGYMVIYQEPGMTASYDDYFGHGRDGTRIAEQAHVAGVVESKRPDYFRSAAIVIDVIDGRSNELIYRNYAKGDVVRGVSDDLRSDRIEAAVGQALQDFFKG